MNEFLSPGQLVRNPAQPDWGDGQVQSVIDGKITVNFEHIGKITLLASEINLSPITKYKGLG